MLPVTKEERLVERESGVAFCTELLANTMRFFLFMRCLSFGKKVAPIITQGLTAQCGNILYF